MSNRGRPSPAPLWFSRCSTPCRETDPNASSHWLPTHERLCIRPRILTWHVSRRPQRGGPPGKVSRTTPAANWISQDGGCRPPAQPLPTRVAARSSASPKPLSRIETHACQKWSMTDLNSSTNQPISALHSARPPRGLPFKTHPTNLWARGGAQSVLLRTNRPGSAFGGDSAEQCPTRLADRDD